MTPYRSVIVSGLDAREMYVVEETVYFALVVV